VIGRGSIAKILEGCDREGAIIFASGVSNSSSDVPESEGMREWDLLKAQPKDKCLFYFSTISIFLKETPYTIHKLSMELLVKELFKDYNIIRLGNIEGDTNPNTFINYIQAKRAKGEPVEIREEVKYMISKQQLRLIVNSLPLKGKNEISIFGRMAKVKDII